MIICIIDPNLQNRFQWHLELRVGGCAKGFVTVVFLLDINHTCIQVRQACFIWPTLNSNLPACAVYATTVPFIPWFYNLSMDFLTTTNLTIDIAFFWKHGALVGTVTSWFKCSNGWLSARWKCPPEPTCPTKLSFCPIGSANEAVYPVYLGFLWMFFKFLKCSWQIVMQPYH
jgi:hypothetical protein